MTNSPKSPIERAELHILEYCRKTNLKRGHRLLSYQIQIIANDLDGQEKPFLTEAIKSLVAKGFFHPHRDGVTGTEVELTDFGESVVYGDPCDNFTGGKENE